MALTVAPEEGFDSLVSLPDCEAYLASMGYTWTGTNEAKEGYLRRATQYILSRYSVLASSLDPVATGVEQACCEAALRASTGKLFADVVAQHVESVTVGPISKTMSAPGNGGQVRFAVIDALMRPHLSVGLNEVRLVRA
jgi:hypothetical protein